MPGSAASAAASAAEDKTNGRRENAMSDIDPETGSSPAERFRALEGHADYSAWMRHTPSVQRLDVKALFVFVLGSIVVGVILVGGMATICAPLAVVPMILVGFGVFGILRTFLEARDTAQVPVERLPLIVIDERTNIAGTGSGSAQTRYVHTVVLADGSQRELESTGETVASLRPGRIGIGFVRGGRIVEFAALSG